MSEICYNKRTMRRQIQKVGKFYSKIIMNYIGVFIFVGVLSVIFGDHGWYPNEDICHITQIVYLFLIPSLIGYGAGNAAGGKEGAVVAVLAVVGLVASSYNVGILGAMILGPLCGWCTKWILEHTADRFAVSTHMLIRNLMIACMGGALCIISFYILAPVLVSASEVIALGIDKIVDNKLIFLSSILIEPAKILFLNNGVNHAILTPLGMQQAEEAGKSVLFLLETNPGPGAGVLCSLFVMEKEKRQQFGAGIFAQAVGGVHEVYFPFILSNLRLLFALIGGSMAGIFCFVQMGVGLNGPVSPGSVVTLFMMAGRKNIVGAMIGVGISAATSFLIGLLILKTGQKRSIQNTSPEEETQIMQKQSPIHTILFVCDGGVGSSAMGAALFRRKLAESAIADVEVKACAVDMIEKTCDLIVCQKTFADEFGDFLAGHEIYTLDNLLGTHEYEGLLRAIRSRNEG